MVYPYISSTHPHSLSASLSILILSVTSLHTGATFAVLLVDEHRAGPDGVHLLDVLVRQVLPAKRRISSG